MLKMAGNACQRLKFVDFLKNDEMGDKRNKVLTLT
jgi:hypothetical protein